MAADDSHRLRRQRWTRTSTPSTPRKNKARPAAPSWTRSPVPTAGTGSRRRAWSTRSRSTSRVLKPYADELADALHRPESQTRWEVLGAFEKLVAVDARLDRPGAARRRDGAARRGVRRRAARGVPRCCARTARRPRRRSERVWPLIDEAIRCYHGDPEFPAMLSGVVRLVSGGAADEVKIAAAERMEFDAEQRQGARSGGARSSIVAVRAQEAGARSQAPVSRPAARLAARTSGLAYTRSRTRARSRASSVRRRAL